MGTALVHTRDSREVKGSIVCDENNQSKEKKQKRKS
jgi:hypothetical protein